MADQEIKKIISVDIQGTDSLNTLIKQIDELSKKLETLDKSSQEYKDILSILAKNQAKLSSAMKGVKKDADDAEGSYNALSKKMSSLRKEWKATNDEAKRQELGKQISTINTELKGLDASIGNFQRNVGSYEQAMNNVFKSPRQRIKEMRDELAQLEEGTDAYNQKLRELAQLTGDQTRLNEQLRYSSADLGDVIGNVAGVAQGVIGGLGAIQGVMALFGEEDHYAETIKNLTAIMAIVQGLGALEGLRDKIKGLSDAWKGFKKSAEGSSGVMTGMNDALKSTAGNSQTAAGGFSKLSNTINGSINNIDTATKKLQEQTAALEQFNNKLDRVREEGRNIGTGLFPTKENREWIESLDDGLQKEIAILNARRQRYEQFVEDAKRGIQYWGDEVDRLSRKKYLGERQKQDLETAKKLLEDNRRLLKIQQEALDKTNKLIDERMGKLKAEMGLEEKQVGLIAKLTAWFKKLWNETLNVDRVNKALNKSFLAMGASERVAADGAKILSLSLKGLKAAITATGIGALIVLSGELINLLFKGVDALKGWISGANKAKRQADELKSAMDALNESFEATNDAVDFEVRKMEAVGKSYEEVYNYKRKYLQQQIQDTKQLMAESDAYKRFLTLTDKQKKKSKFEGIVENATELQERLKDLEKQLKRLDEDKVVHDLAEDYNAAKKAAEDLEKAGTKAGTSIKKSTDDAAQALKKYRDELQKTIDEYNNLITGLDRERESPIDRIKREYQERMDLADRAEKAETDLLKSQLDEREISREEYERKSLEIAQKYSEGRLKIQRKETEEGKRELAKQANDRAQAELQAMRKQYEAYQKQMQNQDKLGAAEADIEKYSDPDRRNVWKYLFWGDSDKLSAKKDMDDIKNYYSSMLDNLNTRHNSFMNSLKEQGSVWEGIMNDETLDMDTRAKAQQNYLDIKMQMQDAETENMIRNKEIQAEQLKAEDARWQLHIANIKQYTQEMVSSTTSLFSSMADIYEQDYENKKDGDEKSQRIAKKSFKKSQALRIAEATINTLNGAIGGYTQAVQAYGVPWGVVLGAATAASVTAAGMAQIQKIRSTQFDSSGSSLGSGGTTFQLPQIEQYEPTYTQNVTQESDTDRLMNAVSEGMSKTQLYVSVTDINNVQNKVRVTENEASW